MKRILTLVLAIILVGAVTGCSFTSKEVKIISGNSLDGISICKLAKEENEIKKGYKTIYEVESNKEKLEKSLENEEYDMAVIPTDMAARVYNKNSNYQICSSVGNGSYYLVTSDKSITGFNSTLINKEVSVIKENSMTDIISKSILRKNNTDESKVKFNYVNNEPELVTSLALGKIRTGIVPETSLTTLLYKHSGLKILSSTNKAYEKAFNIKGGYSQFSVIVKKDFAKENTEFVKEFLSSLKSSIDFVNNNPLQAGAYGESLNMPIKPQVLSKAIKRSNLKYIPVNKFKNNYQELFKILYNYNKETVGGAVINESIYYK